MGKDGSVAPKERVNIVYRPAEGDGREEVELPMKLLVVGDFSGSPDPRPLERREPVAVNKDNFNEAMRIHEISLQFCVPNRLCDKADDELEVALQFAALSDFAPEAVVEQVPQLKRLLELREALRALKGPLANLPDFRRTLQELLSNDTLRPKLLAEITGKD
ncbi:type VI secretion system contractile sheath small subunit [Geomesophilobacter sediminis]|uniref:Type VI secretion system contractile sheath small subunit n=1 Tax=Geomesophilobacter sediminis TaxID=2798584 RepID=A0A8J7LUD8_9BACT|nr:type VI secretion system contractile sheath small subunit [Geomesophilobacter sediminis]MBJ6724529.1 type VI secretion system contractile sheath small subunit [Geomesophilobacter sediminis]